MSDAKRDDLNGREAVAADLVALGRKLIQRADWNLLEDPSAGRDRADQAAGLAMAAAQCIRAAEQIESGIRLAAMTATALGALDRLMPEVTNPTAEGVLDLMQQRDNLAAQLAALESVRDRVRELVGAGPTEEDGTPTVDAVRKAIEERDALRAAAALNADA